MTGPGTSGDEALVAAAKRGDASAFDGLVRRHSTAMYRVALRIMSDPVDAEDAVQDAWVSAWRALPGFRGDSAPSTWLYRVVTNAALGRLRRRRSTVSLDASETSSAALLADETSANPEHSALRSEQVNRVHQAIATLDPSQRVPLVLRELEGMDYEEIAAVLDVSVPSLRSRLHRARVALLARLRERE